jgi:hypothetical protein
MDANNQSEKPANRSTAEERDPEYEAIFDSALQLHERLAEIRPDLVVRVEFGDRLKGPNRPGDEVSFRDHFDNGPKFDNVFDKVGDGFINVHGVDFSKEFLIKQRDDRA